MVGPNDTMSLIHTAYWAAVEYLSSLWEFVPRRLLARLAFAVDMEGKLASPCKILVDRGYG